MTRGGGGADRLARAAAMARRLARSRSAVIGAALLGGLVLFAALGPLLSGWSPEASDFAIPRGPFGAPPGPSAAHWLGTDALSRDLVARLASGARTSLAVGACAAALSALAGGLVGLVAGMTQGSRLGFVDSLFMRVVDVLLALPFLLLVTSIGVAMGRADVTTTVLLLGLLGWSGAARLARARTLEVRALDYVAAARALGAGSLHVATRHVLPNLWPQLLLVATTSVGQMILAEAALGYLSLGVPPPQASWGRMLHEAEPFLGTRLGLALAPGFAIVLAVLGSNRLGEGIRESLGPTDARAPRSSRVPFDLVLALAGVLLLSIARPNAIAPPLASVPTGDVPRRGGTLRVATFVNVRTLDPALAFDEASRPLLQLAFARLLTWDAEGRLAPDLCQSFARSPDGLTHTFELREGARFHDGSPVTAADVKRSLERLLHPKTPSPGGSMYSMIRGFAAYHAGKAPELSGVRVLGERLLAIDLEAPDQTFLPKMTLAFAAPVCASMASPADPKSPTLPCGAGPFRVAAMEADKGIRLARHEGYFDPRRPWLDGVEWSVTVPITTQRYKFERGELDYVHELSTEARELYRASPAWSGLGRWKEQAATTAVFLNTELPPFDSRDVRRAVSHALEPEAVARMRSDLVAATRVIPPGIPGPDRSRDLRRFDLEEALADMARAGFAFDPKTGRGGYPHPIDYVAVTDSGDQQAAEVWQQQLARIGLRVRLRLLSFAGFLSETQRRRASPMGKAGWAADFPDPSNFFDPILTTEAISDHGSENVSFYSNHALDRLLDEARVDLDPARRLASYERAEAIIAEDAPFIPTFYSRSYELWQPWLRGYAAHPVIHPRFDDVWLGPRCAPSRGPLDPPLEGCR